MMAKNQKNVLVAPYGREVVGGFLPMLRALRALALGYDCRALTGAAAPRLLF
ncbi:MAG: hypothetical protein IKR81_01355 [Victivallales bacterium]|nr:hypothetical protein [Victivallales bacterium]